MADGPAKELKHGPYLDEASAKALKARLARIEGHVRSISRMIDDREWADEILLQTAAVKGSVNRFASVLVEDELRSCLQFCDDPDEQVGAYRPPHQGAGYTLQAELGCPAHLAPDPPP